MELLLSLTALVLYSGISEANPCGCDCGASVPQCAPALIPCPPPVICPPPPICPPVFPCPMLPPMPCPSLCMPSLPLPMLFAENSCCTGCPAPCAFRARKRREVSAQAFAKALRNLSDDPVCNNAAVKRLIEQNLVEDVWSTKEMLQKAVMAKFPSTKYNIICATGDLAYTAQTHDFCLVQRNHVSCYVFRPS